MTSYWRSPAMKTTAICKTLRPCAMNIACSRRRGNKAMRTIGVLALMAGSVFAHHSFTAEFDQNKPIKLTGKVTEMKFSNPHSWIYMDVETDGKVVNWALE